MKQVLRLKMSLIIVLSLLTALFAFTRIVSARIAAQNPPRGKFVAIGKIRLHYTELLPLGLPMSPRGVENNTVLLLHGASGNQPDMMIPLGEGLAARGFRVIAMDRPGLGWSERPSGFDVDPARQSDLIAQGLAALNITKAIVVGHSLAGVVACAMALDHPGLTSGLVLLAPVTHPWPGGIAAYYTAASTPVLDVVFTELLSLPVGLASMQSALHSVFGPQAIPDNYVERSGIELVLRPQTFRANARDVAALHDSVNKQAPRLGQITAPTAIVTGDADAVVLTRVHSYGSAKDIPGATLDVLPGVGHSPQWSSPDAVFRAVEQVAERAGLKAAAQ